MFVWLARSDRRESDTRTAILGDLRLATRLEQVYKAMPGASWSEGKKKNSLTAGAKVIRAHHAYKNLHTNNPVFCNCVNHFLVLIAVFPRHAEKTKKRSLLFEVEWQ